MINLAKNQAVRPEENCLRRELSQSVKAETEKHPVGDGAGGEIIRLTPAELPDRAQFKAAQRIEASLRYMMQHLNQPMKVPMLSAMVGLSDSSFYALFKCATGQTPLDFFIRVRMHRAGELLAETTLQIKEVAAMLGYDDQFYFSRMFKSVHGIAPREYRARKEESDDQNLKRKPANQNLPVAYVPPHLPRLVPAGENQMSGQVLIGGFQPAAKCAKAFPERCRESAPQPAQTCSVHL